MGGSGWRVRRAVVGRTSEIPTGLGAGARRTVFLSFTEMLLTLKYDINISLRCMVW